VNRRRRRQRGAVSVELALGLPILIAVIMGGIHFGLVLTTRHRLGDAANYATRLAAIARNPNPNVIRAAIAGRLGADSRCTGLDVRSTTSVDAFGVHRLDVTARCTADTGIGGALLSFLGSSEISVRASMPY
jgi:Flp pilus assembly protein TadG